MVATSKSDVIDLAALGRAIRAQRTGSLRAVAPNIGISPASVSRVENGMLPDLETYARICRWLGVSLDTFVIAPATPSIAERVRALEERVAQLEGAKDA